MNNLYTTLVILAILALTACGKEGPAGTNGVNGKDGQSIVGPTGPQGQPGTQIDMIQFCQGVTPTYPSTFPEYGIKIGTQIWGVYSTNGGFLALLPPGVYSSNAVGSACTFTINSDGSITE